MSQSSSNLPAPTGGEIILYQTEDGRTRIQCRFENETLWLTQTQIAELFQTTVPNINLHLKAIYAEAELPAAATIKSYLMVRSEGSRQVSRPVLRYSLPAILAVGYRVRSHRGTQFRQWATARLSEYLLKGFTMDDERLKNPPGKDQKDYFPRQFPASLFWMLLPQRLSGFCPDRGNSAPPLPKSLIH
jgi:hypothetical protein